MHAIRSPARTQPQVAGKKRTLAELWNGTAWTITETPK